MAANLTKPLVVPQWDTQSILFYTPSTNGAISGQPVLNPNFSVGPSTLSPLFQSSSSNPNVCLIDGTDLYVSVAGSSHGVAKLPGYLADPATAKANAFALDLSAGDYVGLAMDAAGNLYAAAGDYNDNTVVRYSGARGATGSIAGVSLGNAGNTSYFGDMAFDSAGNLWAADYRNNRLVVFESSSLSGAGPATWLALQNPAGGAMLATANTAMGFPAKIPYVFASPEGLDFDSFGADANLWVVNNNDGYNATGLQTANTAIVLLTSGMLNTLRTQLSHGPNNTAVAIDSFTANTDYRIYQVPSYASSDGSPQVPQLGGLQIDKATGLLYVNDETSDPGNGWVRVYNPAELASIADTPSDNSSELVSNSVTSQSGNGGLALVNLGPYIGDTPQDTLAPFEPDASATASSNVPWESPNIVASIDHGSNLTALPVPYADPTAGQEGTDTILGGVTRYIYVQVNNFGPAQTTGLEQLNLYWAKGSSTLNWPQPWDGNGPTDPLANLPLGGIIYAGWPIPAIEPFGQVIVGPVPWMNTPDPTMYEAQDGHFCLLARIVTPNANYAENASPDSTSPADPSILAFAGMSFPENSGQPLNLNTNVIDNARIAWRNIHIIDTEPGGLGGSAGPAIHRRSGVVAVNYGDTPLHLRFAFEFLDAGLRPLPMRPEPLKIHLKGREPFEARCLEKLHLKPGESSIFHVEHTPPQGHHEYALRASAFATEGGKERLIGGQTFLYRRSVRRVQSLGL